MMIAGRSKKSSGEEAEQLGQPVPADARRLDSVQLAVCEGVDSQTATIDRHPA